MAQPFDAELEELVSKFSQDLADEIRSLILRRLGIERAQAPRASSKAAPVSSRPAPPSSPQPPRSKRGVAQRVTPRGPTSERRQTQRPTSEERAATLERVQRILAGSNGLSAGDVERQSGLPRAVVGSALKTLKEQGRAFMGGTKRFARYAATQAVADQASLEARRGNAA